MTFLIRTEFGKWKPLRDFKPYVDSYLKMRQNETNETMGLCVSTIMKKHEGISLDYDKIQQNQGIERYF